MIPLLVNLMSVSNIRFYELGSFEDHQDAIMNLWSKSYFGGHIILFYFLRNLLKSMTKREGEVEKETLHSLLHTPNSHSSRD